MIVCETVQITVTTKNESGELMATAIYDAVPAYTRNDIELVKLVRSYLDEYVVKSLDDKSGMSVADFALFLIPKAATEPREMA